MQCMKYDVVRGNTKHESAALIWLYRVLKWSTSSLCQLELNAQGNVTLLVQCDTVIEILLKMCAFVCSRHRIYLVIHLVKINAARYLTDTQGLCRQNMYNFAWSGLLLKCAWSMSVGCDSLTVRSGRRLYSSALTMNESLYLSDGSVHIVWRHDRTVCCAYLSCGWWTNDFFVSRMHYTCGPVETLLRVTAVVWYAYCMLECILCTPTVLCTYSVLVHRILGSFHG